MSISHPVLGPIPIDFWRSVRTTAFHANTDMPGWLPIRRWFGSSTNSYDNDSSATKMFLQASTRSLAGTSCAAVRYSASFNCQSDGSTSSHCGAAKWLRDISQHVDNSNCLFLHVIVCNLFDLTDGRYRPMQTSKEEECTKYLQFGG